MTMGSSSPLVPWAALVLFVFKALEAAGVVDCELQEAVLSEQRTGNLHCLPEGRC